MKRLLITSLLSICLALPTVVTAEENVEYFEIAYNVSHRVQKGVEKPHFSFVAPMGMTDVEVRLQRAGWNHTERFGAMSRGQRAQIELDQPAGEYRYHAWISGVVAGEREMTFEVQFSVVVVEVIELQVIRDRIDFGTGLVPIEVNRPVNRIEIEVADEEGNRTVRHTQNVANERGRIDVRWPPRGSVGAVQITAHDVEGYWASVTLEPFWVEIEHETILFNFGTALWDDSEEPKLRASLESLRRQIREKRAEDPDLQLYIAGYTDTVGQASANLALSARRAQAIARWFLSQGIEIPIYYQGFGQEVLAVDTPDETEEAANRRAIYILGNTPPPTSDQIPRQNWRRVR